jgi:hypothetical protein
MTMMMTSGQPQSANHDQVAARGLLRAWPTLGCRLLHGACCCCAPCIARYASPKAVMGRHARRYLQMGSAALPRRRQHMPHAACGARDALGACDAPLPLRHSIMRTRTPPRASSQHSCCERIKGPQAPVALPGASQSGPAAAQWHAVLRLPRSLKPPRPRRRCPAAAP